MDQTWKSINGFIVSFKSSFDKSKISFYTEIKKGTKKSSLTTVNQHKEGIHTSFGPVDKGVNFKF